MGKVLKTEITSPAYTADAPQQSATGVETPNPVITEGLPEKFKGDLNTMVKSYGELETKLSGGTPAADTVTPAEKAANLAALATANAAADAEAAATKAIEDAAIAAGDPAAIAARAVTDKAAADKAVADKVAADKLVADTEIKKVEDLKIEKKVYYGEAIDTAMEGAGLQPEAVAQEWTDKGELSPETYASLAKAGYPSEVVNMYIKGFQDNQVEMTALQETQVAEVMTLAGGQEGYAQMHNWAAANVAKTDLIAYNEIMDGGDHAMIKLAVQGMNAKYIGAVGRDPALIHGGDAAGYGDVFISHQQVAIAMKAARESGDPAQIHAVEAKALRSPAL